MESWCWRLFSFFIFFFGEYERERERERPAVCAPGWARINLMGCTRRHRHRQPAVRVRSVSVCVFLSSPKNKKQKNIVKMDREIWRNNNKAKKSWGASHFGRPKFNLIALLWTCSNIITLNIKVYAMASFRFQSIYISSWKRLNSPPQQTNSLCHFPNNSAHSSFRIFPI